MTRTLLVNGRIWQWSQAALAGPKAMLAAADEGTAHTMAEWMLLEHGRIASVGTGAPPEAGEADTIDLGGRLVLPGLIDAQQLVESAAKLDAAHYPGLLRRGIPARRRTSTSTCLARRLCKCRSPAARPSRR